MTSDFADKSKSPAANARPPERDPLELEIDRAWHIAAFSEDPDCTAAHWQRHNALVAERARRDAQAAQFTTLRTEA
jgi:hypothetical protein